MKIVLLLATFFVHLIHTVPSLLKTDPTTLLHAMTLDEKIGQLFMVAAVSDSDINKAFLEHAPYTMDAAFVEQCIKTYHVGGIIFLGAGTIESQYRVTKHFQSCATIPLLIGQDCEWGLAMRITDAIKFPYALTLSAIADTSLIYQLGHMIGTHCAALGVHINFAPVADINTNPHNPVIGYRSFGNNVTTVTQKSIAFAQGLMDAGIIACAKHAPGHGDTSLDSHLQLPVLNHGTDRLETVELEPFKALITHGIPALMMGHIAVPSLDSSGTPASLSRAIITERFRNTYQFDGLIVTDGLGMRAVTDNTQPGEVELAALNAGNDILLCPVDIGAAHAHIKAAITCGTLSESELDSHVLRILQIKHSIAIQMAESVADARTRISNTQAYQLKQQLFDAAITTVCDTQHLLPLLHQAHITHVAIGTQKRPLLTEVLERHVGVTSYAIDTQCDIETILPLIDKNIPLIISIHGTSKYARDNYGIRQEYANYVAQLSARVTQCILVLFANPYSIAYVPKLPCILCAYEDEPEAQRAVGNSICGILACQGILPV